MKTEMKIQEMVKKVNKRKTELAELQGEKRHIEKQIAEEGCGTIKDIEREIEKEEKQIEKIEKEIEKGIKELEEEYDWE